MTEKEIFKKDIELIKKLLEFEIHDKNHQSMISAGTVFYSIDVSVIISDVKIKIIQQGAPVFNKFNLLMLSCVHTVEEIDGETVTIATYSFGQNEFYGLLEKLLYKHRELLY
jgi:hypothetical protein